MSNENKPYTSKRYFGMALDPIHIGTGGYRLGRVDNTIARDAATNLPIIFGSSIEGTARTYAYYHGMSMKKENKDPKKIYGTLTSDCAGKGDPKRGKHQCGTCAVCVAFGYTEAKNGKSLHGMAQFSDTKILFFPVHTIIGPVWVTSPQCLKDAGVSFQDFAPENWPFLDDQLSNKENKTVEYLWITDTLRAKPSQQKLNLGWIYLSHKDLEIPSQENKKIPDAQSWEIEKNSEKDSKDKDKSLQEILKRVVMVSSGIFHQIVNSNLEVRTSVSINPQTGAAEEGALFTYEAIPRTTVMYFDVVYNKKEFFEDIPSSIDDIVIKDTVEKSFCLYEHLGIGGMGTRGFGRFKILNLKVNCDATST